MIPPCWYLLHNSECTILTPCWSLVKEFSGKLSFSWMHCGSSCMNLEQNLYPSEWGWCGFFSWPATCLPSLRRQCCGGGLLKLTNSRLLLGLQKGILGCNQKMIKHNMAAFITRLALFLWQVLGFPLQTDCNQMPRWNLTSVICCNNFRRFPALNICKLLHHIFRVCL